MGLRVVSVLGDIRQLLGDEGDLLLGLGSSPLHRAAFDLRPRAASSALARSFGTSFSSAACAASTSRSALVVCSSSSFARAASAASAASVPKSPRDSSSARSGAFPPGFAFELRRRLLQLTDLAVERFVMAAGGRDRRVEAGDQVLARALEISVAGGADPRLARGLAGGVP